MTENSETIKTNASETELPAETKSAETEENMTITGEEPGIPADPETAAIREEPVRVTAAEKEDRAPRRLDQVGTIVPELERSNVRSKTSAEIEEENWQMIRRYERSRELLYSRIIGVEPGGSGSGFYVITSVHSMRVIIPDSEFFPADYDFTVMFGNAFNNLTARERRAAKFSAVSRMIGARICLVITNAAREKENSNTDSGDESGYTYGIIGSRVEGMKLLQDIWFFHKNRRLDNPGTPRSVQAGDVTKANVLYVRENGVRVECFGVETYISAPELSGIRFVTNCHDEVKPGDVIDVMVRNVTVKNDKVTVSVSKRQFDSGFSNANIRNIKQRGIYAGVVRSYNPNNGYYTVYLENGVMAAVHHDRIHGVVSLDLGDEVAVRISSVYSEHVVGDAYKF